MIIINYYSNFHNYLYPYQIIHGILQYWLHDQIRAELALWHVSPACVFTMHARTHCRPCTTNKMTRVSEFGSLNLRKVRAEGSQISFKITSFISFPLRCVSSFKIWDSQYCWKLKKNICFLTVKFCYSLCNFVQISPFFMWIFYVEKHHILFNFYPIWFIFLTLVNGIKMNILETLTWVG